MATGRPTVIDCSLQPDEENEDAEQFVTAAHFDDETLNQAANGEQTPEPDPCSATNNNNNNYEPRKAQPSIWSRFICRGMNKPSPPPPPRYPSCGSPCQCCSGSMDLRDAPVQQNNSGCHFDDPPVQNPSKRLNRLSKLSKTCSPAIPGSSRNVCPLPKRRRLPRLNSKREDSQKSSSPQCVQPAQKLRRQRRGRKRKSPLKAKGRTRKKPPWLENFFVSPDIWRFLRNYRQQNPQECLEDMVENSMSQYREAEEEDMEDNNCESTCNEDAEAEEEVAPSFRDAASVARSLSNGSCESSGPPSIKSLGNATFDRDAATPLLGVSRMCNASCKSPSSVCKKSITATRLLKSVSDKQQNSCFCQDGFSMIGPGTSAAGRRNWNCGGPSSSTPVCEPKTSQPKSFREQWQSNKDEAAFQHFLNIYRSQNPSMTMAEALQGAECAWRKLSPKYKRLYRPRVYTPTHLSPESEAEAGENGIGQTLVGVLTKKIVDTCKGQWISPRNLRLLRSLIGSEVTVRICNVKKRC